MFRVSLSPPLQLLIGGAGIAIVTPGFCTRAFHQWHLKVSVPFLKLCALSVHSTWEVKSSLE